MLVKKDIESILSHLSSAPTTVGRALQELSPAVSKLLAIGNAVGRGFVVDVLSPVEAKILAEFRGKKTDAAQAAPVADTPAEAVPAAVVE